MNRLAAVAGGAAPAPEKPERRVLRVGFLALSDCAPIVVASLLGFDEQCDIHIVPVRCPSWAALRDGLLDGTLDAAQALYGMVYAVQNGIGSRRGAMAVLMTLNRNGQAITLSNRLGQAGVHDGFTLARTIAKASRRLVFAQTFPTGTHALWLNYWLAAHGIDPTADVDCITVPPAETVAHLASGAIDGYCAGEPWNEFAVQRGTGFTVATSQQIWPGHPEKVLAATAQFVDDCPRSARALVRAVLAAARYLDEPHSRERVARILAHAPYLDCDPEIVEPRLCGRYTDALGTTRQDADGVAFYDGGTVPYPYLSDAVWFMTQHRRWGLQPAGVDYAAVAARVQRIDVYCDAARAAGVPLPVDATRSSCLMDGRIWDGSAPEAYALGFEIGHPRTAVDTITSKGNVR